MDAIDIDIEGKDQQFSSPSKTYAGPIKFLQKINAFINKKDIF